MAKGGGGRGRKPAARPKRAASAPTIRRPRTPAPSPAPRPEEPTEPFRLGMIPGATPGTWIDRWNERMAQPIELVPLTVAAQRDALTAGDVDAALVRLPIDRDGLHVIPLYDEVPVVVTSSESHLTAADELTLDDLAGEVVITPLDDVLHVDVPRGVAPAFAPPATTEDAVATVAAGVGVVIVPLSLARLHHRRDAAHRPLQGGPASTVALAWIADRTTPSVDAFVGIVRGRTANSSRS